jgi:hypothetical protein
MGKSFVILLFIIFIIATNAFFANSVSSIEALENSWTTKAPMPQAITAKAAAMDEKIYVMKSSLNYEYDPETDSWTAKTHMPTPRDAFAIAACQNRIYVIGGVTSVDSNGIHSYSALNEVYDPETDTWETRKPMPTARGFLEANVVNDKIYVMGGRTGEMYTTVAYNEVYDPVNDSWTIKAPLPYPVVDYASVVVDDKVYVIGGQDEFDPRMNLDTNQVYNPATDTWSMGTPAPFIPLQALGAATSGVNAPERIYVIGGSPDFGVSTGANHVYDPALNNWTVGASMPLPRTRFALVAVGDLLYAIGGYDGWTTGYSENQQYIPFGYGTVPPHVHVLSPESKNYTSSNVSLAFTVNKPVVWMGYSLDGQEKVAVDGNITLAGVSGGLHNVTVYANDSFGNMGTTDTIAFTIAVSEPEPFPVVPVAIASVVSAAIVGAGLLVYFKKRKR